MTEIGPGLDISLHQRALKAFNSVHGQFKFCVLFLFAKINDLKYICHLEVVLNFFFPEDSGFVVAFFGSVLKKNKFQVSAYGLLIVGRSVGVYFSMLELKVLSCFKSQNSYN